MANPDLSFIAHNENFRSLYEMLCAETTVNGKKRWAWKCAVFIAWSALPKSERSPRTIKELCDNLGITAGLPRRWRFDDPQIDVRIAQYQSLNLLPYEKRKRNAYIYLFRHDKYFKIGVSCHPAKRLREIQTFAPQTILSVGVWSMGSERNAYRYEEHLHVRYKQHQSSGEWFVLPESEVAAFCAEMDEIVQQGYFVVPELSLD